MKIRADWLADPRAQSVCGLLSDAGYQALFVGGCVRNTLLNAPVADLDIATDATPETVTNLAESAGYRVIPTGFEHGTVTILADGHPFEVTTFRRDVETDGRHATVAYSTSVHDDASRRDFTINALYAQADGTLIDPLGGLPDLTARIVRFVGDADDRIREDYLRILRFFRFHAWYGAAENGLDADGLAACAANIAGIDTLSQERIGAEMRKLLSAPDPAPAVGAMAQCGALGQILPGADARALPVLVHLEGSLGPSWLRRLAVLGGTQQTEALRLSRSEARDFGTILAGIEGMDPPAALGYRHGRALATDIILARAALLESPLPENWAGEIDRGAEASFPIRAADLMPALQGPALGEALRQLEDRWIGSDFRLSRADLLA